ncbi:MAG: tRNA (guanosine(37)-N1)-methyltransferase TrmD [Candidatus Vogelbacteria bacterium]|nr:tRNA (guanosine(37)-N1)-methyltransferase TrmD [Candidatus Vogelbacteria bacterium]
MHFHVITIFPKLLESYLADSILARAIESDKISVQFYNPRDFTEDKHHKTDDRPYAGGPGMVMYAAPILHAVESAISNFQFFPPADGTPPKAVAISNKKTKPQIFILSPRGEQFTNLTAKMIANNKNTDIILICGRYEGIDARVKKILKAKEISVGPYVLTGGELPAMIMIDSIARQIQGVLGDEDSVEENRTAAAEVYTRPEILEWKSKRYKVPKVLLSGDHKKIEKWKIGNK